MSFGVSKQRYESGFPVSWGWEAPSLSPFLPALKNVILDLRNQPGAFKWRVSHQKWLWSSLSLTSHSSSCQVSPGCSPGSADPPVCDAWIYYQLFITNYHYLSAWVLH